MVYVECIFSYIWWNPLCTMLNTIIIHVHVSKRTFYNTNKIHTHLTTHIYFVTRENISTFSLLNKTTFFASRKKVKRTVNGHLIGWNCASSVRRICMSGCWKKCILRRMCLSAGNDNTITVSNQYRLKSHQAATGSFCRASCESTANETDDHYPWSINMCEHIPLNISPSYYL